MQIQNSNIKNRLKYCKLILTAMFIFTALLSIKPIIAHAEDNSKSLSYDGTDAGEGASVGSLYWGGSTDRTGLLMYIVNSDTGDIITPADLGQGVSRAPIAIQIYNTKDKDDFDRATHFEEQTHFGVVGIHKIARDDMPHPVNYNESTSAWYGNNDDVRDWLFSEVEVSGNKLATWQVLVAQGYSAETLVKLMTIENLTLVVEPISVQAVYSFDTWGDKVNTYTLDEVDNDYKYNSSSYLPAIKFINAANGGYSDGKIIRMLSTGRAVAYYNYTYSQYYISEDADNPKGGANWKWTNQAMPYCMTLEHDFVSENGTIKGINESYPERKDYKIFYNEKLGYAMSLFVHEIKMDAIHTYDIDNNPTTPAPSEQPSKDKGTTGDVTIVKMYYHATVDGLTGDVTWESTTKTTSGTTGYIVAQDETDKTGYRLQIWGTVSDEKSFAGYKYEDAYSRILKWKNHSESTGDIRISNAGVDNTVGHKYVYLLYSAITLIPAPEVQSYDFEIPESYITKQVYFSLANNTSNTQNTAQKLIQNTFEWKSEAHITCPGHNVWKCTTEEHEHATAEMDSQGSLKCTTPEHSHSDGCLKKRYECKKCDAQEWYDWNAVSHTSSCTLTSTEKADAANYSVSRQVRDSGGSLECTVCGQKSSDKHWVSSISHADDCTYKSYSTGSIPDSAYKCANAHTHTAWTSKDEPGCYNTVYTTVYTCNDNKTSCSKEEHEHSILGCTTVKYCSHSLSDSSLKFSIQNTKQSDYPNILATNPTASTTIKLDKALKAAFQGSIVNTAKAYKWFETTRTNIGEDSKTQSFDYTTILLRGSDELTLPEWKKDYVNTREKINQPAAMDFLTGANSVSTKKFKVGNTPQGTRKYATYQEVFSAAFKDGSEDKETVLSFNYPSGVSSTTLEWVSNIIPIRTFDKCDANTKVYTTVSTYQIPTIKVKVNVFSDYQDPNTPTQSQGNTQVTFYPYVKMYYDTPSSKNNPVFILGEEQRHFEAHDSATITYTNTTGLLDLTSAQWSTHKSAKDTLLNLNSSADPSKILPGGAALDISISQANTQTVIATTYQV